MDTPLKVTFRGMDPSEAVRANIEERTARLERVYDRITGCHVIVELPHRHKSKGKLFDINIEIVVPGDVIVVTRTPSNNHAREDIYVALRDAFNTARRRLEDFARKRRKEVKTHQESPRARVVRIFPEEDYGFLATQDGREIYFHRNAVIDGFERLEVGSEVRFVEATGDEGPQASTVEGVD
ncbi:MAG: HPF/RaiA family ribosome-associated protein [bacterium]|nr:MAG: HPF/RaiA family ribosome-associated protein [bacterium]